MKRVPVLYKMTIIVMLTVILFSLPVNAAEADNGLYKEENIYASLGSDGSFENAYVINSFTLENPGLIEDYGEYDTVLNLTTTDMLEVNAGKVRINAPAGQFYYQGNTSSMELPWLFKITYLLNGKKVNVAELSGAEGLLQIHIEIRKNPGVQSNFADHYTVQTSLTLNAELCSGIAAEGAAIANAGGNKVITYTMLPGREGDYTISANVSDFHMEGIQISAVPLSMDIEMPDTGIFTEKLSQLTGGIAQLDNGVKELDSGVKELSGGAGQLKSGMKNLQPGISGITKGLQQLGTQNAELTAGSDEFLKGLTAIMNSLPEQMAQLKGALTQLVQSYEVLNSGLKAYTGGVAEISKNSAMINKGYSGLLQGVNSLYSGISELNEGTHQLAEGTGKLREGTSSIDGEINAAVDKLLESFTGGGFEQVSYLSRENKDVEYVQFILMTDGIDEAKTEVTEKAGKEKLTLWDRFLALFGI